MLTRLSARFSTLDRQLLVWGLLLVTGVMGFVLWFAPRQAEQLALQGLEQRVRQTAQVIAIQLSPALDFQDVRAIEQISTSLRNTSPDLIRIEVADASGITLFTFDRGVQNQFEVQAAVYTPDGRRVGTLLLGVHLDPVSSQIQALRVALLLAGGMILLLSLLFTQISARWLTRSLREVQRVALAVSKGDYSHRTNLKGLSEAEQVGEAFDVMMDSLEQTYEELKEKSREAEAANQAKSTFLANMTHEIRTPMNGVLGMASLLETTELTEEQKDYVETILHSGETLMTIINDILDFSKIEAGKIVLERIPFSIHSLSERSVDLICNTATSKGLDIATIIDQGVPDTILGDPTRIHQILLNLLSNAVKFTPKGFVILHVSSPSSEWLELKVQDSGIGIPKTRIPALFDRFSQVDASTTRRFGGTGLGLAISVRLTHAMGGEINVESDEGSGSTFTVRIPLYPQSAQPTGPGLNSFSVSICVESNVQSRALEAILLRNGAQVKQFPPTEIERALRASPVCIIQRTHIDEIARSPLLLSLLRDETEAVACIGPRPHSLPPEVVGLITHFLSLPVKRDSVTNFINTFKRARSIT